MAGYTSSNTSTVQLEVGAGPFSYYVAIVSLHTYSSTCVGGGTILVLCSYC